MGNKAVKSKMVDPDNYDFRPLNGGTLTEKGAYLLENESNEYWIPGRKFRKASTPVPKDDSTVDKNRKDVMFLQGLNAKKHIFYLWEKPANIIDTITIEEGNIVSISVPLTANTKYYWRVDAFESEKKVVEGDVCSFTTS